MAYIQPTVAEFKGMFARDFPFSTVSIPGTPDPTTVRDDIDSGRVLDSDVVTALMDAQMNVNPRLFESQAAYTRCFCLLAAHMLCRNFTASSAGLGSKYSWLTQSKSAGNLSQAYAIPQRVLESPFLASLTTTTYGAQYVATIWTRIIGNVRGLTHETGP